MKKLLLPFMLFWLVTDVKAQLKTCSITFFGAVADAKKPGTNSQKAFL